MLSIRHHICIISRRLCCTGELWLINSLLHLLFLSFAPKEGVIHEFLCIKNICWFGESFTFCILKYWNQVLLIFLRKTLSLWTETGAWWLSSWFVAVWSLSGRQIQRYFPSNIHCNTKVVHTAQVHALKVFVGFLKGSLSYYFCTFILEYWPRSVRPRHFRKWIQLSLTSVMKSRRPYWLVTSQCDCTCDDL